MVLNYSKKNLMYNNTSVTLGIHHSTAGLLGQSSMPIYIILVVNQINSSKINPLNLHIGQLLLSVPIEACRAAD
jgi:hypothetical protein